MSKSCSASAAWRRATRQSGVGSNATVPNWRSGRHLKPTNKSWRVDETYVRVKGRWCYLYRAIDSTGATATEAAKSIKLIRQMSRVANREIPYAVFFTRKSADIREKTFRNIEAQFASAGVPVLECSLIDRAAYRSIFSFGGTIRTIDAKQVSGLPGVRENAQAFVQSVLSKLSEARAIA